MKKSSLYSTPSIGLSAQCNHHEQIRRNTSRNGHVVVGQRVFLKGNLHPLIGHDYSSNETIGKCLSFCNSLEHRSGRPPLKETIAQAMINTTI